ncbi:TPA: FTR1 family protein [Providencia stuartii]|uniref:FTR1 family iron permease n=1 Tax=Providencia TaxID=586 RepID=UPI002349A63A|nr:FTR1 family protein [Providencia sp. PROV266]ELR5040391.1 FTR1 family protein [Providencia stuartii]ELR5083774.1 FTR1 family protein [Providencia stuartii]MDV5226912.1 FTR1 family protein [Providencia rettgeri]HEF8771662.1 FTR1 family protein [Providencia stuartii]
MGQVLFVVWRESFEALLVIGIIYAWIKRHPDSRNGMKFLWGGVVLGLLVSILLALLIYGVFNVLDDTGQSLFMVFMEILACILIVQMVYWMNKHGSSMKSEIESGINRNAQHHNWWGAALIIAIAIAREGSEIVVFLSSFIMSLNATNASEFAMEVGGGILIAGLTLYIFLLTNRIVSWKIFFKVTGVILLFLALSLLLKGVEEIANLLIEYDYSIPEFLIYPAWDTTALLDDSNIAGNFISSFFAYRSQPIWLSVITFIIYWVVVITLFSRSKKHA